MSRKIKYHIHLTRSERATLEQMTRSGRHSTRELHRVHILLERDCSEGKSPRKQSDLATDLGITLVTVNRVCQRYCEGGLSEALYDKARSGRPSALDSHQKAKLTALACSKAPEGHSSWSHKLLADRFVELNLTDSISSRTVGRHLKKTN